MKDTNYQWQKGQCDERLLDAIEAAIETVEKMHSLPITLQKIRKARNAAHLTDKKQMWDVLQEFYAKYKSFINGLFPVLGYKKVSLPTTSCLTKIRVSIIMRLFLSAI